MLFIQGEVGKMAAFFRNPDMPEMGYRNSTIAFILTGSGFQPGGATSVTFFNTTSGTTLDTQLKVVYPTQISGRVDIPEGTETGSWNINVTTADGGTATLINKFSVL